MLKKQLFTLPLFLGALLLSAGAVKATTSYSVAVNTSSLSGTTGSLDFQFNPGVGVFQSATVQISGFAGGTYGGSQTIYGSGVTGGPIPAALSITNTSGQDNEVLDSYTFANSLTFTLNFSGPAITSPNGGNTAGSLFAFSVFSDAAGLNPALTSDPSGVALSINLNPQGVLSPAITSPDATITPEPSSLALLSAPLVLFAALAMRRRHSARAN